MILIYSLVYCLYTYCMITSDVQSVSGQSQSNGWGSLVYWNLSGITVLEFENSITGESERLKPKNLMLWQWYPWKIHEIHHGVLVMTLTFPWSPKKGSKLPAHRWGPHHEVWKILIQARCAGHPSGPYPTSGTRRTTRWGCWTFWGSFFFSFSQNASAFVCLYIYLI